MTTQTLTGGVAYPAPPSLGQAGTLSIAGSVMDAAGEGAGYVFRVPKTGNIAKVGFLTKTVTVSESLNVGIYNLTAAGVPDTASPYGGMTVGAQASVATDTGYTVALGTAASATVGNEVAVAITWTSFSAGNLQIGALTAAGQSAHQYPYFVAQTGSWARIAYIPVGWIEYDDGTYAFIQDLVPASALANTSFNTGSAADEIGLLFSLPFPSRVLGFGGFIGASTNNPFDVILYEGTTAQRTVSFAANSLVASATRPLHERFASPFTTVANTTYRLVVKPTSANSVALHQITVPSAAAMNQLSGGTAVYGSSRVDAGAWTDSTTTRPYLWLILDQFDDGAGGGIGALVGGSLTR